MTREEAIEMWVIPALKNTWNEKRCNEVLEALDQEPCEDAISRQAVFEIIRDFEYKNSHEEMLINSRIKQLPSVTPAEKVGRWIKYSVPRCGEQHYQCTSCKYYINFGQWGKLYTKEFKYCPNCGAKMEES